MEIDDLISNYGKFYDELDDSLCNTVNVPLRIGIDRMVIRCDVISVDWNLLESVNKDEIKKKLVSLTECRSKGKRLLVCEKEPFKHWYSAIRVSLPQASFSLRKCNIPGCNDISVLEILVPPIKDHEILDNVRNQNYSEERNRILYLMDCLEEFGIVCDRNVANVLEIELNVTFSYAKGIYNNHFQDIVDLLRPFRICLKGFTDADYAEHKMQDCRLYTIDHKMSAAGNTPRKAKSSFYAVSASRIVKIYDKTEEIEVKSKGKIGILDILTRLEFILTDQNEIPIWFDNKNFFEMSQKDIDTAFHGMMDKYMVKPLREYYRKITKILEQNFASINVHERAWRKKIIMRIDALISSSDGYMIFSDHDIEHLVSLINAPSVYKNKGRIAKSLIKEINEYASSFRVDHRSPEAMLKAISSINGEEGKEQIIAYIFNDDKEKDN